MYELEHPTIIDFLNKYCKTEEHKKCYGIWIGLGFRVDCNCLCHHKNMLGFSSDKNHNDINVIEQNNNFKNAINVLSSSGNSIQNRNNDISEKETANLHFSLTSSSSQKRSLQHNIKSNGDSTLA